MQHFDFDIMYSKFNQTSPESASFCKRYDKNILVCFSIHSSNCCSLQNVNAKFHKVK